MKRILNNQKGFVFVDALIGMVILAVALTALALAYRQASITTVAARDYNNAVFLAQQAAEMLKENDGKTAATADWAQADKTTTINNVEYTVATTRGTVLNSLQPVTITVSWLNHPNGVSITNYYYLNP